MPSVWALFLVEQVAAALLGAALFAVANAQLSAERKVAPALDTRSSAAIVRRLLWAASLLLCLLDVDPYGIHGIYKAEVATWLFANVLLLLFACGAVQLFAVLQGFFAAAGAELHPMASALLVADHVVVGLAINFTLAVAALRDAWFFTGYAYLAVALGLFVFAAVFIVFVFQLDSLLKREATRRRLRSALQRLTVLSRALGICVLAVCAFALPVFWEMGFRTVEAGETRMPQSLDDFDMASRGWRIAAYVAAIVLACASQVSGETRRSGRVSLVAVGGGSGDDDEEGPQVWDSGAGDDGL